MHASHWAWHWTYRSKLDGCGSCLQGAVGGREMIVLQSNTITIIINKQRWSYYHLYTVPDAVLEGDGERPFTWLLSCLVNLEALVEPQLSLHKPAGLCFPRGCLYPVSASWTAKQSLSRGRGRDRLRRKVKTSIPCLTFSHLLADPPP